jgi:N-acetylglucosaminyldiphosphoundecaprenol N-acetyl-beta-D-mannosaminyltransferase
MNQNYMEKELLNYKVYKGTLSQIDLEKNKIINTINSHSFCVAKKDTAFKKALVLSDILLPDGIGIVWAEKFLNGNTINKIAGYDLFLFLMHKLEKEKGTVFFLGASNDTLNKIKAKCKIDFPNVTFGGYSPPYKAVFSDEDSIAMCDAVNTINPDVLFVGMTAPKQEKWVNQFKDQLQARNICAIGAVFDFYTGSIKRINKSWVNNSGLEGVVRLISSPSKKLIYRNFISSPKFIFYAAIFKLKKIINVI